MASVKIICENQTLIQKFKAFAESQGIVVQFFTVSEWESSQNTPILPSQQNSSEVFGKVLQFPNSNRSPKTMSQVESETISEAITSFGGNLTEAAKNLGIGRATLYRKVKEYNIDTQAARLKKAV